MAKYRCTVCNYVYDEAKESRKFSELPETWKCPVCGAPKSAFVLLMEEEKAGFLEAMTVSDVLIEQMAEWGIKYVFGIPGTSSLGAVDAIKKNNKLTYMQVRHEQTAALMASAYGKLTGNVAACLTVAGPGATNLATGLYDAKLDHAPVLALTGMVKRVLMGPGSFQEIDQAAFFEPISIYNKVIMSEEQTTTLITLAIKHAIIEKGVSHIGIPNDVQKLPYKANILPFEGRVANAAVSPSDFMIGRAASVIQKSKRPVIISGFGAIAQGDKILALARKITAPIVTTFRGKGVIDEEDELYVGSHGGIGSTAASELTDASDLLIVVGSSYSDMTAIPEKKTVQIDISQMMLGKSYPVEVGLWGHSAEVLSRLLDLLDERVDEKYLEEIRSSKKDWIKLLESEINASAKPIRPDYIIKVLNDLASKDAVITLDTGENAWWFGRNFFMQKTQKLVFSGNLGSMGIGLPAALAAQLVFPKRQVICITGDGGFSMVMGDFLTAVKYKLPIKVILFDNKELAMIAQEQKVEGYPNWATDLYNCDFAKYAENCGGLGIRVNEPGKLPDAVKEAFEVNKPALVDIDTDPKRFK
jgi:thiamine pyrophosphate-dependent acetolactate synthase large subunit-like protein/rubredoxin